MAAMASSLPLSRSGLLLICLRAMQAKMIAAMAVNRDAKKLRIARMKESLAALPASEVGGSYGTVGSYPHNAQTFGCSGFSPLQHGHCIYISSAAMAWPMYPAFIASCMISRPRGAAFPAPDWPPSTSTANAILRP